MHRQTLEAALSAALKQQKARESEAGNAPPPAREAPGCLLTALQHSATEMDKIVQRRIGLDEEPDPRST